MYIVSEERLQRQFFRCCPRQLGSLLSIIYVNDIKSKCSNLNLTLYADDNDLESQHFCDSQLQENIKKLNHFLSDKILNLNFAKAITQNLSSFNSSTTLAINNVAVEQTAHKLDF